MIEVKTQQMREDSSISNFDSMLAGNPAFEARAGSKGSKGSSRAVRAGSQKLPGQEVWGSYLLVCLATSRIGFDIFFLNDGGRVVLMNDGAKLWLASRVGGGI